MGSDQDGVPSKVSDSGVGGLESGEDSWISDTEVSNILCIVSFRRKKRSEILKPVYRRLLCTQVKILDLRKFHSADTWQYTSPLTDFLCTRLISSVLTSK